MPPVAERERAIRAQALYLLNLTLLPGIAFLMLWRMQASAGNGAGPFARQHLRQAFIAGIWSGALLVVAVAIIASLADPRRPATWIAIIVYVICVHSTLLLAGVIGLSRAMAGKAWRYPLIGPR
jgi:hypothetical protein